MEAEVGIRRAQRADAMLLAATAERMFRDAFAETNDPAQMDAYCRDHYGADIQRAELERADACVLFAEREGVVVGYAQLLLGTPTTTLWRFYVDRHHHGRGVAPILMHAVLDEARRARASHIQLSVWEHNPRAIAFYRKHAFEVIGTQPFHLGTELQTDLTMRRDLD